MRYLSRPPRGQVLPAVVGALMVLVIFVPLMVTYTQNEAKWTQKQASDTVAFHMAEAGIEKAYLYMTQSTSTWGTLMLGNAPVNYSFDRSFSDLDGGTYSISITSGPGDETATVISVGRDARGLHTRAIKAVYSNSLFGATAIYAGRGVQLGGQVDVEWGAVMSPYTVDADSRLHPQFWSASQITTYDTTPNPPNCDSPDCCQWHSYQANLPPAPTIDFDFYRSSAMGNTTGGCPGATTGCYYNGSVSNWNHNTSGTIFIEGTLGIKAPGLYHRGNIIVMGNIELPNGNWGSGNLVMSMPPDAWKQYCRNWNYYRTTFDTGAPAQFPGINTNTYSSPSACNPISGCTSSKVSVNGLMYVGGNFNSNGGGGGNSDIYGVLYAVGSASSTANSPVTVFFNSGAADAVKSTTVNLTRASWQDVNNGWPSGL